MAAEARKQAIFTASPPIGGIVDCMYPSICAALLSFLRDAEWLTPARARAYSRILAAMTLALTLLWIGLSHDGLDPAGRPLGTDFLSFWAASKLALAGHAAAVYDPVAHAAAERAVFAGGDAGYAAFFYPPIFLLYCLPLATLPYFWSLSLWLGLTGLAYWHVVRQWSGAASPLAAFAFPAVFLTVGHGQNAFLATALFGAGALLLKPRPVLAGICFGALVFKPHLGILIPIALLAAGRWRSLAVASITAAVLGALALAIFGAETWRGFVVVSGLARGALEHEAVGSAKMSSLFAAIRLAGGPVAAAYGGQAILALGAAAAVWSVARRRDDRALGAALIAAALLATPFLLDYDLLLAAIPLAWMFREGAARGFLPWEKTVLAAVFLLPLLARVAAMQLGIALAPLALMALLALVVRRGISGRVAESELGRIDDLVSFHPSR